MTDGQQDIRKNNLHNYPGVIFYIKLETIKSGQRKGARREGQRVEMSLDDNTLSRTMGGL